MHWEQLKALFKNPQDFGIPEDSPFYIKWGLEDEDAEIKSLLMELLNIISDKILLDGKRGER